MRITCGPGSRVPQAQEPGDDGTEARVRALLLPLAGSRGVRGDDPTAGLPMPKLEKRLPRPLSIDDCAQLITKDERAVNQPVPEGGDRARRHAWMKLRTARWSSCSEPASRRGTRGWMCATSSSGPGRSASWAREAERVVPIPEQARLALRLARRPAPPWLDEQALYISLRARREEKPRRLAAREARRILRERGLRADLGEHVHPHRLRQLRDPSRHGRRSAGDPGAARPRESLHDPEIHGRLGRAPARRL